MKLLQHSHKQTLRKGGLLCTDVYIVNPEYRTQYPDLSLDDIESWVYDKNKSLNGSKNEYLKYENWGLWSCISFHYRKINKHRYIGYREDYKKLIKELNEWALDFRELRNHSEVCGEIFDSIGEQI